MDGVALGFLAVDVGVLALNALVDRPLGRNCSAMWLSAGLMFGQVLSMVLGLTLDRPWRWATEAGVDLFLLFGAVAAIRQGRRAWWAYGLSACLMGGLVLQVALWLSWLPHRNERYDWALYHVYLRYVQTGRLLATLELCFVAMPGIWGVAILGARLLDRLYRVPDSRRALR
jgi:hypothetical protein